MPVNQSTEIDPHIEAVMSEQIRKQLMCFAGRVVASAKEQEQLFRPLPVAFSENFRYVGSCRKPFPFSKDDLYGALTLNSKTVIKIEDGDIQSVNDVNTEQSVYATPIR
ncbi:MAG: hypothetical protein LQ341_002026 [Variospora aurantia]|nr:MAG: hypothetical protein LQ341_002026 [Variospora aurantia]